MKKLVCLILALVFCMSLACTAFAAEEDGFVPSPSSPTEGCTHGNLILVGEKDPSCTEIGYTGDYVCEACGEVIEEGTVISKTEHNYVDGVCTVCGSLKDNPVTGDNSHVFLWVGVMAVAVVGLTAVVVTYRKKFSNQ